MTHAKIQVLSWSLAAITAFTCIYYEKLVNKGSIMLVVFANLVAQLLMLVIFAAMLGVDGVRVEARLLAQRDVMLAVLVNVAGWVTTPLWFYITKNRGVIAGGVAEIKYLVILALIYAVVGTKPVSANLWVGLTLSIASIYFISK